MLLMLSNYLNYEGTDDDDGETWTVKTPEFENNCPSFYQIVI